MGDEARVIIVSTHCRTGERIARIDKAMYKRDFGSMIAGFGEVDSLIDDSETGEKVGVKELKDQIAEAAVDLTHMGMPFNRNWRLARDELLAIKEPHISYDDYATVCQRHGLDPIATKTLADLMHDLGYIVYYGDDDRLKDDVVLQPEWLTKAIGFLLEDRTTQEMDGILPDSRLRDVWQNHPFKNEPRYDPEFYPFFLRLTEKFDVSYRLEGESASLVAQHVPQVRPGLPWLPEEDLSSNMRRIAMVCVMDEEPTGLVPWMIVRTHEYVYQQRGSDGLLHRLHWQRGMFLRKEPHGEAMLELRGREFHVYIEAVWPEYFKNVIRRTLQKLIVDNWPGLADRYYFAVPCGHRATGALCHGRFDIDALHQFLEEGDDTIRCQNCRTRQNIVQLLYGFEKVDSRDEFTRIETRLETGFDEVLNKIEGLDSRLANYVMAIMQAMANEAKNGPRLFTIAPLDGSWKRLVTKRYELRLWCEAEGSQHPVMEEGMGGYDFEESREWIGRVAPYVNFIAGVLKTVAPLALPAAALVLGEGRLDKLGIENHLALLKEGTGALLSEAKSVSDSSRVGKGMLSEEERSGVLWLHAFLKEHDPYHGRLGLTRAPTFAGDYLWLCQTHHELTQSRIPERFD